MGILHMDSLHVELTDAKDLINEDPADLASWSTRTSLQIQSE